MMASITFSVFVKLFHVALTMGALCSSVEMTKVVGATLGLRYANFKKNTFTYLNISCLGTDLLQNPNYCGFACLTIPSCFSYNLAAFPDINGKMLCELLPSDMYNMSQKLVPSEGHHHFSIASQCSSWPCKNKGKCVSLYEENSYVCVCEDGFTGKNCETNVDECQSNPCLNNGTCVDKINGFNCRCPPGFVGDRCQTALYLNSSVILGNNSVYLSNLTGFLAPAVGNDSKWLLCYRASTHGWRVSEFHNRCDGLYHTITIIQVGQYIFGGYTDIPWESSDSHASTSNAFIFSLRNREGLGPFKSLVTDSSHAMTRYSRLGPTFGWGDIQIADRANSNTNSHTFFGSSYSVPSGVQNPYTILAGTNTFTPDDWEVFYLA